MRKDDGRVRGWRLVVTWIMAVIMSWVLVLALIWLVALVLGVM
jgi:hypothetical protein